MSVKRFAPIDVQGLDEKADRLTPRDLADMGLLSDADTSTDRSRHAGAQIIQLMERLRSGGGHRDSRKGN
ncbi:hypothetical protein [Yoonia sp. 2307UL14-13]|uniref:hypothetical protein n=1 Tax=Yoonia sp. 2307UL14-13 TaxID=3126506 RepID=UPI0030B02E6D